MTAKKIFLAMFCISLSLVINIPLMASQVQMEERTLVGHGASRSEAIINGLVEAIRQVQGLEIEKLEETRYELEDIMKIENGIKQSKLEESQEIQHQVTTETDGVIESYEVLRWEELSSGEWEVLLRVEVPYYESRTAEVDEKSNLAVMPLNVEVSRARGLNQDTLANQISRGISAGAVQSDFFRVVDREYDDEWEEERDLLMEGDMAPAEKARLGEKLGVDYLIVGTLTEVYSDVDRVDYYGLDATEYQVNLAVDLKVIEFATREIVWADIIEVERSGLKKDTRAREEEILNAVTPELVNELTRMINHNLGDILMPLYVIEVRGDEVYLNQGRGRFAEGEKLRLMGPPEKIEDPYTDRTRTFPGEERGRLEHIESRDDYSRARLIEGREHELREGLMVERLSTISTEEKTGIMLSEFAVDVETEQAMQEIITTPPAEALHISLINSTEFPEEIEIFSPRGVRSDRVLDDEISIPDYILDGEIREFTLEKLDSISGIFFEKYAMEFSAELFWRILDNEGNTIIMDEKTKKFDFETTEISGDEPREYLASIEGKEIKEAWECLLSRIEDDIMEIVVRE